jgi:hypothetical protein
VVSKIRKEEKTYAYLGGPSLSDGLRRPFSPLAAPQSSSSRFLILLLGFLPRATKQSSQSQTFGRFSGGGSKHE